MRVEAIMDILRRDLTVLFVLLLLHLAPQPLLLLVDLRQVPLQARHERVVELRVVLLHAVLLRLFPDLQHERQEHRIVRRLVGCVCGRRLGRRVVLEPVDEGGEVRGALGLDLGHDLRETRLEDLVAGDVGPERRYAQFALLALFVDRALFPPETRLRTMGAVCTLRGGLTE